MNTKITHVIAMLIEYLPVTIAAGLITLLLGGGIIGGQTAGAGAPATPFGPAMAIGVVLIVIGAAVIAAPLLVMFISRRGMSARPDPAQDDNGQS
jgi:hypothetical protein